MKIDSYQKMTRSQIISELKNAAPVLTSVSFSDDMGYEFSAIVPDGVIYAEPGMLLNFSEGCWPPDEWEDETTVDKKKKLEEFLLEEEWPITFWENIKLKELRQLLEIFNNES